MALSYRLKEYGVSQWFEPGASTSDRPTREVTTVTCQHHGGTFKVEAMCDPAEVGGLCKVCMRLICPECVGKGCTPLEERLRLQEDRARFGRELERAVGGMTG